MGKNTKLRGVTQQCVHLPVIVEGDVFLWFLVYTWGQWEELEKTKGGNDRALRVEITLQ